MRMNNDKTELTRPALRFLVLSASLMALSCNRKIEPPRVTSYEGHSLGENSMAWSAAENQLESDPLEACKEIVRSGSNPNSKEAGACQHFILTGDYTVDLKNWRSGRKRIFWFTAWKLSGMLIEYPADQTNAILKDLTLRFGSPSANQWRGPDRATISNYPRQDDDSILIVILAQ
jgi:hypothetical protein